MTTRTIFNADHEAFRESAAAFVDRSVMPRMEELGDMWLEAGAQGFLGLDVPAAYGGGEAGDWRFNAVLAEELSRASVATSSAFGIHYDVCAPYLVELTTDEQKQRWLPGFCSGQLVTAIGMTEPSGGSDLAALKTTAVREGDGWILNGSKTFITNGSTADLVIIAAATTPGGGSRGISLFVVEKGTPGFEPGRVLDKIGQPEADTAELFLTDVHVPAENMIGELDQGFIHMMENLAQERIGAAVANIAHARSILDETLVYIKERTAFGKPVGSFQHNAFLMADIVAHTEGRLTAVDAAKSKWWTADVQGQILDACVQLHGGYGFMREYRVARAWADARVTRIWAGSNEIMKLIISRDLGL
jgi:alkylation response protein AidB-like acyl-CoA dehydrogenase